MKKNNHYKIILFLIITLKLYSCDLDNNLQSNQSDSIQDSVKIWIKASRNSIYSIDQQKSFLSRAYNNLKPSKEDSIRASYSTLIAYRYYQLNDSISFKKINNEAQEIAKAINNSYLMGDSHWNYADFYFHGDNYPKAFYHYNQGYKYFNLSNAKHESARMLLYMGAVKGRFRDYSGSEVLIFEAIKKFENLGDTKYIFDAYTDLGLILLDIKEYDQALKYFNKALTYANDLKNEKLVYEFCYNNIGLTYIKKKDFKNAIKYFDLSLSKNKSIHNYARLISNRAFARLKLGDTTNVKLDMFESKKIRDSLNNKVGILASKIRISEYYEYIKDTITAIQYAKEANTLAKKIKNGGDYLTTLEQLADLEPLKANLYLHLYSNYSDSLHNAERKTINKFTRIEFETDEVLEDNKILNQQLIWIFSGSIALILILSLLYFIRVQRAKNEKLFLETEQQKANEQVYLLTLRKQAELEEEKVRERNRISQELHDGILGRLFGTRVGMGFLDINADEETQKQHESFLDELQEIEKEIREVSHKLNDNFEDLDVNFTTIINQLLESKSKIGDFKFHLNIDQNISWKSTDEIIKVNVYRIIQEALQNTIKHAKAENVTLDFSTNEQELNVHIKDDGVGFNLKKSKKGIGLKNIKSRIEKLNGTVDISSAPNKGTQIHIKIPIV